MSCTKKTKEAKIHSNLNEADPEDILDDLSSNPCIILYHQKASSQVARVPARSRVTCYPTRSRRVYSNVTFTQVELDAVLSQPYKFCIFFNPIDAPVDLKRMYTATIKELQSKYKFHDKVVLCLQQVSQVHAAGNT